MTRKPLSRPAASLALLFYVPIALFSGKYTAEYATEWLWRAGLWTSHAVVEAHVVDMESYTSRSSRPEHHVLTWAWTEDGVQHQGSQEVAPSTYDRTEIGDPLKIYVDEDGRSILPGWKDNGETLFVDGAVTFLLGLVCLIFGLGSLGALKRIFSRG